MLLAHYLLQIKKNIYSKLSKCMFHVPVVTQFILKAFEKSQIVPFLKVYHFSIISDVSSLEGHRLICKDWSQKGPTNRTDCVFISLYNEVRECMHGTKRKKKVIA